MEVPFLNVIVAPLRFVVWLADQPWGPFVGPAIVGLTMVIAGMVSISRRPKPRRAAARGAR
jgi:hypothetical protein